MQSDGVVNLFDEQTEFSLFDEKFMEEVKKMKEKNLAAKLLEDLLRGRVRTMTRINIVSGELFSERFSATLNRYVNGLITNEEVIQELLKMAKEMMDAEKQGNELGLSNEEKAFYDALTRPQAVKDFYSNDQLVEMTKDLTDMLRKNRTIDWNRREAERANMRRLVKRLLKKYKYPPEEAEGAMNIVLKQCEQWADVEESPEEEKPWQVIKRYPEYHVLAEQEGRMAAEDIVRKIELSSDELYVLRHQLKGDMGFMGNEKASALLSSVIDKAEKLMKELDAYEESGDNLLYWFYEKYKAQNGIIEKDLRPKGRRHIIID